MSLANVREAWPSYNRLTIVFFAAVNGTIDLDDPGFPFGPFPKNDPAKWSRWTGAVLNLIGAVTEAKLTDTAFRTVAEMLVASEALAAKVTVPTPSADDVETVLSALRMISTAVAADQRFHAALDIADALSTEIRSRLVT